VTALQILGLDVDGLNSVQLPACFPDLTKKQFAVLGRFRFELQHPGLHCGPGSQLLCINIDPNAISLVLVIETQRIPTQVEDPQPAVSHGTWREKLNGVGQATPGLAYGIKQHPLPHLAQGQIHHEPTHHQTGSGITVKGNDCLQVFFISIRAYLHVRGSPNVSEQ